MAALGRCRNRAITRREREFLWRNTCFAPNLDRIRFVQSSSPEGSGTTNAHCTADPSAAVLAFIRVAMPTPGTYPVGPALCPSGDNPDTIPTPPPKVRML
jgi:hypothetical protein